MVPHTVEEYVRWVLNDDPTLAHVDPEVKQQLEADYVWALEDQITAAIVSSLPADQLAEAEKMMEHSPMAEVQAWIGHRVPNADEIIAGVLLRFRTEYLSANDVI